MIVTIGAIGYTAESFFQALQNANVDTFIDVRRRRAVRGREYAFANSQRLQARLAELGIRYVHPVSYTHLDVYKRQRRPRAAQGPA